MNGSPPTLVVGCDPTERSDNAPAARRLALPNLDPTPNYSSPSPIMNSHWQDLLGASAARFDPALISDFGDAAGELQAAQQTTVIAPLADLGLIECSGGDAKTFLHNQLTSNVNQLSPSSAQHSAWCTAKGRMLASIILYRQGAGYRALLAADLLADTLKRLQMFVLRSQVKLADRSADLLAIGVGGVDADALAATLTHAGLPLPAATLDSAEFADGNVIRLDAGRCLIVVARAAAGGLWSRLAERARPVGTPVWQWLDIRAGLPRVGAATREAFVPQMADFDRIGGVSFNKGCYPGQEIIARTKYLGKVKRHLYRLHALAPLTAGLPIFAPQSEDPGHPCGQIANAAPSPAGGYDALAVIQENHSAADLALGSIDGTRVERIEPVFSEA